MLRTSFRTLQTQRPLLLRCGVALAVTLGAMGVCGMTGEAPRSTMASDSGEFSGVDWKAKLTAAQYDVTRNVRIGPVFPRVAARGWRGASRV